MRVTRVGSLRTGELARAGHRSHLEHDVGLRRGLAGEHPAGGLFLVAQGLALMHAMDHAALDHPALAGAAGAVLAAIGKADALADRRGEDRLVAIASKLRPLGCTVTVNDMILCVCS